ncbi:MAG TPA: DUF72 domain-containing protein [Candidatus Limnocylindrales bacterium]
MAQTEAVTPHDPGPEAAAERLAGIEDAAAVPITLPVGGTIRIGTASWTDPTMTAPGVFYPRGADSAEERLQYYASRFPVVEVDATYYAMPAPRVAQAWVERTPPDFVFDAKAHALLTGQPTETRRLPRELRTALPAELAAKPRLYAKDLPAELLDAAWELFLAGLEPLRASGQLGSVLLQYPRWVFPSSEHRAAILAAHERLAAAGIAAAVEFRAGSWFNEKNRERTLNFLAEHRIPLVLVDGPQGLASSIPPLEAVTSPDLAVVRFHGRRTETWEAKGIPTVERFRYLYDRAELADWVPRLREAAREAREVHALMNNCYANYGSTNARELAAMLLEPVDEEAADSGGEASA